MVSGRLGKGETARREEAALARGAGPAGPTALGRENPACKGPEAGDRWRSPEVRPLPATPGLCSGWGPVARGTSP